ncbi:Carbonic anhydrase 2 [Phytophthora cinnamomi]|uniref:Carbonic anhydrase 2 n=1 Tax=Phytophthora cinnamomi TaxID=4785 RepID=UPI00355A6286|nr:Carbonic anhydrase 2 [Phytophthora cinnamomi]
MAQLESYINDNCTFTLETMRTMLAFDMNVQLSTSTISRHLRGMTYTVKQTRIEPMTCNNLVNRTKRQIFAKALKEHQQDGDFVVYFDETNYNLERGSVRMEQNAAFIDAIYVTVKASPVFNENYGGKKIVVVLDNAPAHRQTGERVTPHDDLVLLRLAPYSPMCNPIEGCFSVLKAHIKEHLALDREAICDRSNMVNSDGVTLTIKERTMHFLELAALASMKYITITVVTKMELHARDSVNAAEAMADMIYGT